MAQNEGFPLVSWHLSLDLVNTEVVLRGIRHNFLVTSEGLFRMGQRKAGECIWGNWWK